MKSTKPRGGKIDFTIPGMFPLIENGAKHITIRKHRKNDLEVGGILKVYLGNRFHGGQRYLGTAEILALEDIKFYYNGDILLSLNWLKIQDLYRADGFDTRDDFIAYHRKGAKNDETVRKQIVTFGNQSWLN